MQMCAMPATYKYSTYSTVVTFSHKKIQLSPKRMTLASTSKTTGYITNSMLNQIYSGQHFVFHNDQMTP